MTSQTSPAEQIDRTTTRRSFTYDAWVPEPLPVGKTEDDLRDLVASSLVAQALAAGYALDPASLERVSDELCPHRETNAPGRRIVFRAYGFEVKAEEVIVETVETDPGVWTTTAPIGAGLYSVRHGLDTEAVVAECLRADGSPIGYAEAVPITSGDVTVIVMPGTACIRVTAAPDAPENADEAEPGA